MTLFCYQVSNSCSPVQLFSNFSTFSVGEPNVQSIITWEPTEIAGKDVARVHFKILKNEAGSGGAYEIHKEEETPTEIVKSEEAEPICIAKNKTVPPPVFWPILGKPIEGKKRLLVFQLLPMGASLLYGLVKTSVSH
jgi:hypothetical protein